MFYEEMVRRVDQAHDAYPASKYRTLMELPLGVRKAKGIKAVLQMSESADNHCLFQVAMPYSTVHFKTFREATDFCKRRGLM